MDSGDSEHQILKTYQSPGMYVTGIRVQDGSIYLSRVAKSGDTYTDASEDTIMNRDMQDENLGERVNHDFYGKTDGGCDHAEYGILWKSTKTGDPETDSE